MEHRTYAEINLTSIQDNYKAVKSLVGKTKIMSVVKANAYGHGAEAVAQTLENSGTDYFAVANTTEAKRLRHAGIHSPILVFGNPDKYCIHDYFSYDLDASVSDIETAEFVSSVALKRGRKIPIHFKIDTGMGRYGLNYRSFLTELIQTSRLPGMQVKALWSHFPNADSTDKTFTTKQIEIFNECARSAEKAGMQVEFKHISNSAGILNFPEANFDFVRPGLLLYGYLPGGWKKPTIDLTPAMSLVSTVSLIKKVPAQSTISYGSTWKSENETEIAVIPIGYADGVLRILSNKMQVEINGTLFKQIGNVTMDNLMVKLGTNHCVKQSDRVTLFGPSKISANDWAELAGTISWEILCSVTNRVPRVVKN